jgi:hypothetical protein
LLGEIEDAVVKNIVRLAYNPSDIIIYDNFNFINGIYKLAGGRKDTIDNLISAYLVLYLDLEESLLRANFNFK